MQRLQGKQHLYLQRLLIVRFDRSRKKSQGQANAMTLNKEHIHGKNYWH